MADLTSPLFVSLLLATMQFCRVMVKVVDTALAVGFVWFVLDIRCDALGMEVGFYSRLPARAADLRRARWERNYSRWSARKKQGQGKTS